MGPLPIQTEIDRQAETGKGRGMGGLTSRDGDLHSDRLCRGKGHQVRGCVMLLVHQHLCQTDTHRHKPHHPTHIARQRKLEQNVWSHETDCQCQCPFVTPRHTLSRSAHDLLLHYCGKSVEGARNRMLTLIFSLKWILCSFTHATVCLNPFTSTSKYVIKKV